MHRLKANMRDLCIIAVIVTPLGGVKSIKLIL